jgi:polysaccharide export outer membrane protein
MGFLFNTEFRLNGVSMKRVGILRIFVFLLLTIYTALGYAEPGKDYQLGAGDIIDIRVFRNSDLSQEARVSESGFISYPLIGRVEIGGLTIDIAEQKLAKLLTEGGFIQQAQVNIVVKQINGNLVSVLGQVNRPGRYPLETFNLTVSDILASAGGIATIGADAIILVGVRDGKSFRKEIDIDAMYSENRQADNILVRGGDEIYVRRAPMFYIYGEVQRPGSYRIEKNMTEIQALAQGGGPTTRGTEHSLRLTRRDANGKIERRPALPDELIKDGDVLYVSESIF